MTGLITDRLAGSRLGRPVLFAVLGLVTVQAIASVRNVVQLADKLSGRDDRGNRGATIDVDGPAETAAGDPSPETAADPA